MRQITGRIIYNFTVHDFIATRSCLYLTEHGSVAGKKGECKTKSQRSNKQSERQ